MAYEQNLKQFAQLVDASGNPINSQNPLPVVARVEVSASVGQVGVTSLVSTVATTTTEFALALAANENRKMLVISNTSNAIVLVSFDDTGAASHPLAPGEKMDDGGFTIYRGPVYVMSAVAGKTLIVTEG